jgi:hypothetical protein
MHGTHPTLNNCSENVKFELKDIFHREFWHRIGITAEPKTEASLRVRETFAVFWLLQSSTKIRSKSNFETSKQWKMENDISTDT